MQLQKISSDGDVELRSESKLEHTSSAILTNPAILELSNVLPGTSRGDVESNSLGVLLYFTFLYKSHARSLPLYELAGKTCLD